MRTWAQGTARAVVLTASFVALGAGIVLPASAFADTNGNHSAFGGNQLDSPVSAPVDVSGNAAGVGGESAASSKGGTAVHNRGGNGGGKGGGQTSGVHSLGGGNQVNAPVSAPVNACGNAIAIFGTADAGCKGGASVKNGGKGIGGKTSGKGSVLGGNQVNAPISAPINACGNAVALFGSSEAGCEGGSTVRNSGGGARGNKTNGKYSIVGGNQVYAPISNPVNVCGNSAALFGEAVSGCKGGAKVHNGGGRGNLQTSGKNSVLGGNQLTAPVSAPVDVCGNAVGNAAADCEGGAMVHNGGTVTHKTTGEYGIASGNQAYIPVSAPVSACGNAASVLGDAAAMCHGGSSVTTTPSDPTTSGEHGIASGNQAYAPITTPVNVCGNAAAVLGDAAAGCAGGAHADNSGVPNLKTSGKHGVGAGNQLVTRVNAPTDVCGNVAAVFGYADPGCGAEGGDHDPSRVARQSGGPVATGATPVLPMRAGLTKVPSAVPGAPLPVMPKLPVQPPAKTPGLPGARSALPTQMPQLPVHAPAGAPQLPVHAPAGAPQLPSGRTKAPAPAPAPAPAAVAAPEGELVGALPAHPSAGGHLTAPQLGEATDKASGLQHQVGAMRPVVDAQPMSAGMAGDSVYVMLFGTLLAGAAAVGGLVRRLRRR